MIRLKSEKTKCPDCTDCPHRGRNWGEGTEHKINIFSCYREDCKSLYKFFGESMSASDLPITGNVRQDLVLPDHYDIAALRRDLPCFSKAAQDEITIAFDKMGIPKQI